MMFRTLPENFPQKEQDELRIVSSNTVESKETYPLESNGRQYQLIGFDQDETSMVLLPTEFKPGPFDVVCGRGKAALVHSGNSRFRDIIKSHLPAYEAAPSKLDKSIIVSQVVTAVEGGSSNCGKFVKQVDDRWYVVESQVAREKCGQSFRDLLHDKYRSSTRAKAERRKISNMEAKEKSSRSLPTSRTNSPRIGQATKPPSIASCPLRHRSDSQLVADLLHEKRKSFDQTFHQIMRQCSVNMQTGQGQQQQLQYQSRKPDGQLEIQDQNHHDHHQNQLGLIESHQLEEQLHQHYHHHQQYQSLTNDNRMEVQDQHHPINQPLQQSHFEYSTRNNEDHHCDREDESTDGYEHLEWECKKKTML